MIKNESRNKNDPIYNENPLIIIEKKRNMLIAQKQNQETITRNK